MGWAARANPTAQAARRREIAAKPERWKETPLSDREKDFMDALEKMAGIPVTITDKKSGLSIPGKVVKR